MGMMLSFVTISSSEYMYREGPDIGRQAEVDVAL